MHTLTRITWSACAWERNKKGHTKIQRMCNTSSETTRASSKPEWIPDILWSPFFFTRRTAFLIATWHVEIWAASTFAFRRTGKREYSWSEVAKKLVLRLTMIMGNKINYSL